MRARFAELDLHLVRRTKDDATGSNDVCNPRFHMLVDVTEDAWSRPIPVVDIAVVVSVPEVSPLRSGDEMRERRVVLSLPLRSHRRHLSRALPKGARLCRFGGRGEGRRHPD